MELGYHQLEFDLRLYLTQLDIGSDGRYIGCASMEDTYQGFIADTTHQGAIPKKRAAFATRFVLRQYYRAEL